MMCDIPTNEFYVLPQSIWHISGIMDDICGHLSYKDLKSLRLVNKTFLEMSSHTFVRKSVLNAKHSLAIVNGIYNSSNIKNLTAVKFEWMIKLHAFEAFFGIWKKVTEIRFDCTKIVYIGKPYELTPVLMKDIRTISSSDNKEIIFRTSAFPEIEKLLMMGYEETFHETQIILDGPISPIELTMSHSYFIKNGNNLSPEEWQLQPELNFSRLKKLYINILDGVDRFSVASLLELETLTVAATEFNGGRVIGWHDNLKIREIVLQGLDINLMELPPSIRKCKFSFCSFKPCKPTNLKVLAIEYEYSRIETFYLPEGSADSSDDLTHSINLSECKDLRSLIIDSPRLNTSFLPSSIQYLKMLFDCDITGVMFAIDTLSLYKKISTLRQVWRKDDIDNILQHFDFGILHIEHIRINFESEFALFKNLMEEVNRQGKTMYLHCWLSFQGHYDSSYYYECKNGTGSEISKECYFDKVKYIHVCQGRS